MLKFFCVIGLLSLGQICLGQGIRFFEGTFEAAKAEAAKQDKLIFVDAYTTWCGPCKMMSAQVFPLKEVGDYFNENFVCYKYDMEKGDGPDFQSRYNVTAFPTLLFIDGKGKDVHREMGARNGPKLIELGAAALKKMDKSGEFKTLYDAGDHSAPLLKKYAYALLKSGQPYWRIANEYIRLQTNLKSEENVNFLFDFANESDATAYDKMIENKEAVIKLKGQTAFEEKVLRAANATLKRAISIKNKELMELSKKQVKKFKSSDASSFAAAADYEYAKGAEEDLKNYTRACAAYIKVLDKNPAKIGEIISEFERKCKEPAALSSALPWAEHLVKLKPDYEAYLQLAIIQFRLDKNKQALDSVQKAIELSKTNNNPPFAANDLKQKIEQKLQGK